MKRKIFQLIPIAIIVGIGLVLRFWGILHGSFAFTYDVGRDLLAVRDLVYFHKLSLLGPTSGQGGFFYGPWWYWILATPFFLSGGNPTFIALFIALTGIAAVLISYWWGISFLDRTSGLFLAGLFAVAPVFISSTTQIWNPNLLILLTLLTLVFLSRINKLNFGQLVIFGFLTMLLAELELIFGAVFIIGLFLTLLLCQRHLFFSKKIIPVILGGIIVELPRVIFELRHNFLQTKVLLGIFSQHTVGHVDKLLRLKIFAEIWFGIIPNFSVVLSVILSVIIILLFIITLRQEKIIEKKKFCLELLIIITVFFAATLFYNKDFWNYYLTGLPVLFAICLVFAFFSLREILSSKKLFALIVAYLFFLSNPQNVIAGFQNPNFIGDAAVYRNQLAAIDYVYQQAAGNDFNYIAYTPPLITHTWRYLFWWYGLKKYGHEPVQKRQERFYVIIEPDPGYEGRITAWLKVRENDGKIVKEETLPSGIMVQTRTRPKE